ncbi:MAG: type II toxin-antitoxin system YhaV family toxin [Waddliaceae bacterium]
MKAKNVKYLLKFHSFYADRIASLKKQLIKLKKSLSPQEYREHPEVKFAARLRKATQEIIPEDPDRSEYRLKGSLKKFRRYKQGLQRYRLFFCFSNKPPIIVYLYINDRNSLRKEGSKQDPYSIFSKMVDRGELSSNPTDPKLHSWISGI